MFALDKHRFAPISEDYVDSSISTAATGNRRAITSPTISFCNELLESLPRKLSNFVEFLISFEKPSPVQLLKLGDDSCGEY